jgi:hypothetical protein
MSNIHSPNFVSHFSLTWSAHFFSKGGRHTVYTFFLFSLSHDLQFLQIFTKNPSCPWNKDIIVCERWEMGEENERKKKKDVLIMWERNVKQNLVSEYYPLLGVITFSPHQLPVIVNMPSWSDTSTKREHPTTNFTHFAPFRQGIPLTWTEYSIFWR